MVIMEEMKARMKRGDILQERRDTINVSSHPTCFGTTKFSSGYVRHCRRSS